MKEYHGFFNFEGVNNYEDFLDLIEKLKNENDSKAKTTFLIDFLQNMIRIIETSKEYLNSQSPVYPSDLKIESGRIENVMFEDELQAFFGNIDVFDFENKILKLRSEIDSLNNDHTG